MGWGNGREAGRPGYPRVPQHLQQLGLRGKLSVGCSGSNSFLSISNYLLKLADCVVRLDLGRVGSTWIWIRLNKYMTLRPNQGYVSSLVVLKSHELFLKFKLKMVSVHIQCILVFVTLRNWQHWQEPGRILANIMQPSLHNSINEPQNPDLQQPSCLEYWASPSCAELCGHLVIHERQIENKFIFFIT